VFMKDRSLARYKCMTRTVVVAQLKYRLGWERFAHMIRLVR